MNSLTLLAAAPKPADLTPLWIIGGYLLLLLALGVFSSRFFRGTSSDFFVASRSIGPFMLLMSIFGTTMTGFALVGSSAETYTSGIGVYGLMASWSGLIHSACFFLVGIKLWAFGKRYGYMTQCQYFTDRFESPGFGYLLFPVLVMLIIPYLLVGLIASGSAITGLTAQNAVSQGYFPELFASTKGAIPKWISHAVIALVVLVYVFLGGVRSTAWANTFQTIVFMATGVITITLVAKALGGPAEATQAVLDKASDFSIQNNNAQGKLARAYTDSNGQTKTLIAPLQFFSYCLIPLSVGMFPHLFQHWLTAKSAKAFRLSVVAHPIFIMIVWVPCVMIGVWATAAMMPNGKPMMFDNANQVLPKMVGVLVHSPWITGVLMAGILAAIMSSLDSQFMCLSTMFTKDVVSRVAGKDRFSDKQLLWLGRGFVIFIVAVTYALSLIRLPVNVFDLGVWCFSGFGGLFPLVFAAVYWKRVTRAGAMVSLVVSAGVWGGLLYYDLAVFKKTHAHGEFLVGGVMPVAVIFATCLLTLVLVSLATQPPTQATLAKFFPEKR